MDRYSEYVTDNQDLEETWITLQEVGVEGIVVVVQPWELVFNAIENALPEGRELDAATVWLDALKTFVENQQNALHFKD